MNLGWHVKAQALLMLCFVGPAPSVAAPLGDITGPARFSVDGRALDPFVDHYRFTVAPGVRLSFSASVSTPPSNWFWINDMDATLWANAEPLAEAHAQDRPDSPFRARDVVLSPVTLGPGEYDFRIFGTPSAVIPGTWSRYDGLLQFSAVATPVPEPELVALWGLAIGIMGAGGRWQRRRSRAAVAS
jgi:hypothetical protein